LANAYRDAAIAVCLGTLSRWAYGDEYVVSSAIPDNGAFRKIKLSIGYWDTTTFQKFQTTLPTLNDDLVVSLANTPDIVSVLEPTEIATLVSTFEAFAVPYNQPTHTVHVYRLAVQGRSH